MSVMRTANNQWLIVVDASVAVKWYLLDEDLTRESRSVRTDLGADRITVLAPGHFHLEVANAIRNALRPSRLTVDAARMAMRTLAELPIQTIPLADLVTPGFEAALRYDCALYDALYIALADQAGCPFVHADRRLHNTLAGRFPRELWIEDFAAL